MGAIGFRIIRLADADGFRQWADVIAALPVAWQDVHLSAGYAAAQVHLGVEPMLAVYEAHDYRVVQPFALRKISIGGIDATDVANLYGYGGPASDHSWQLYAWFHEALMGWFADQDIVSEFCALNPMLGDRQRKLVKAKVELVERKPVVVVNLLHPPGQGYRDRRRAGIKAALNAGVRVSPTPGQTADDDRRINDFIYLYDLTMHRKCAGSRWFFPVAYLKDLCRIGTLFVAEIGGEVESAGLLLTSRSGDAYYHFAASAAGHSNGANDLLVHEMANHARDIGMRRFHLGGGVTSVPDDPVLFYKAGFSDDRLMTTTYFRIIDREAYDDLCVAKRVQEIAETGVEFASAFLPMYRREAS
jgi:hypothetical protein